MNREAGLGKFISAQDGIYESALEELKAGMKYGHWMWFEFPQIDGLGNSQNVRLYGVSNLDYARLYIEHPVLGSRLIACAEALPAIEHCSAGEILGEVDALKLKSSMTLFDNASPEEDTVFAQALVRFFRGRRCLFTMEKTGDICQP